MLIYAVAVLLTYLTEASSREPTRPMPTITNSLVNLGKMEISFYYNGTGRDSPSHLSDRPSERQNAPFFFKKPEPASDEPCPCSSLRNAKDTFLSKPSGLLKKILMNNDLFSYNKEPVISSLCCESHENVQEVVIEFPANAKNIKPLASRRNSLPTSMSSNSLHVSNNAMPLPMMPFIFDTLIPDKSMLPQLKTKSVEIFLFPKKKEGSEKQNILPKKKDLISKDNIQIVGDKELKNNINLFKPPPPVIKKDLTQQEKKEKQKEKEKETEKEVIGKEEGSQIIIEPPSKPNEV